MARRLSEQRATFEASMKAVCEHVPKAKRALAFADLSAVEVTARTGLSALSLLCAIRSYILATPDLGGEESPFVRKIDELVAGNE